jgi:SAM-dependent methyltransferase
MTEIKEKKYINMQKNWYEDQASTSEYRNGSVIRDHIVGNFPYQEQFPYEYWLFKQYQPSFDHICYEYGCGPGRQIRRMLKYFERVDGVDISANNLKNAREYIGKDYNGILKVNDGTSVPLIDKYDFCYSIICLQHIPVYDIRKKILENMHASLKDGGSITIQLAVGESTSDTPTYGYFENFYDAEYTNGRADCRVDDPLEVIEDFQNIGFKHVQIELSDTVQDHHPKWIWIYGNK